MEGDDRNRHVQVDRVKELEYAVHQRDGVIQQLSTKLQQLTAHNYSEETAQLLQQVQILQTQLQHAGQVLQAQTEKQTQTSQALQDATREIVSLQQVITDKDSMMSQLAERLDLISQEYTKLKESHENTKIREKQTNEVVQKLMMDAELMRKQKADASNSSSMSGPSSPTPGVAPGMVSELEVQAKMEALQSELEERYGLHFAEMKQAVVQQYQAEKVTIDAEMVQVKAALERAMTENADYCDKLQQYMNTDDKVVQLQGQCDMFRSECDQLKELLEQYEEENQNYSLKLQDYETATNRVKELQEECTLYKSQNDELKNKINSQQDSVVSLKSDLDSLTSENKQLRDQMNLLSEDLDSQNTEIEEAFLEKSQYIEKAQKLEEEVCLLKSENEELKGNSSKMEDMISSLKEALKQSETSQQQSNLLAQRDMEAGMEIDCETVGESFDKTDNVQLLEEPHIDNVCSVQQSPLEVKPKETTFTEPSVQIDGQSSMCVQEEVTVENATLAEKDLECDEISLLDTKSTGASSVSLEQNLSRDTSNDSEATLTNDSRIALMSETSQQRDSEITQQYISQIEDLKADMARLLDEKTFALSEIDKLSDEIMVLKQSENKSEIELRELDHLKSENEVFQREREEQIESNLTLMADVQTANLVIENLQKELNQALENKTSLEETNKELSAKCEDASMMNQRLVAELVSLGQEQFSSVLSQGESRHGNTTSDMQQVTRNESSLSSDLGSGHSSHTDSESMSQLSSCQSSRDQDQLSQLDSNHMPHFDRSFFFGRQEEVPIQGQEQSSDLSHHGKVDHSDSNRSIQSEYGNVTGKHINKGKTKGDDKKRHDDLEQEILQMQTHVDDLHETRVNLLEHIEQLKKEAKTLEKSTKHLPKDRQISAETIIELEERNKALQDEKDLLCRKISALEWQVTELKTEIKKNPDNVEEMLVPKFMEVEEAVDGGSHVPWVQPTAERSISSQDSIEQEIMVQDSQNSMVLQQEVVEDNILQTSVQKTCGAVISSRMSPDSIDQLDIEEGTNDISADSIEEDESTLERRQQERLESLKQEYEAQLEHLREQLATERQKHQAEGTEQHTPTTSYKETTDQLRQALESDQQTKLDHVIQSIEDVHRREMDIAQQQHVDDINLQVKAMRLTLEQIYTSQLELVRADLENQHSQSLDKLRETLSNEHKEEINRLEADWSAQMAELEDEHEDELQRSLLEEAVGTDHSRAAYIQNLNQKLSDEHRKLLEKISEDLDKGAEIRRHTPKKKRKSGAVGTESEDGDTETESIHSMPVTGEEYQQVEEREKVLDRVEDVRQTLETQREEIVQLRAAMLTEYEQLLALRTETMATHTQEVEKMQHDMEDLQKTYEDKIQEFQAKVESQTGEALRLSVTEQHNKELEILQSVYEQKLLSLRESFTQERVQYQQQIDHLMSLQQEASSAHAQQEVSPKVTSSDENLLSSNESSNLPNVISELESKLAEKDTAIEKLTSQIGEMKERYENSDMSDIERKLSDKCKELDEMNQILMEKDNKIVTLEKEKCEVEEKCARDMKESEKRYSTEMDEMTSRLIDIQAELDASREQERLLEEQYEELQHQHVQEMEGATEDFDHQKHVEVGSLQSEFKVQLEIELKRQAADLAFDHEEKIKEIAKTYEDKIQQLQTEFDEKLSDVKSRASDATPDIEDKDTDTEKVTISSQEVQSDVVDSRNDEDAASSKGSTVVEVSKEKLGSRRQESDNSMESDRESELDTPRGGRISPAGGSAMSYETEDESLSQDVTPGSDEAESAQDTTQDTTQDTDSETVAGLFKEISKAKEDTLSFLRAEYEQKISALDDRLRQVMAENNEYEKDMEAIKEQVEDLMAEKASTEQKISELKTNYENKLKDIEVSSQTSDVEKVRQEYAKEYDENVSQIRREFEEKMDLLRLELQESFETEKEEIVKTHQIKMNEIEEKYENLIESVRSGDAPEVADIVRDRIDTELEMAKSLMQQEFDETLESEQTRMLEQQQQEFDNLQTQHESDIAECRQTLQAEFYARLQELEQLHLEEITKLQNELVNSSVESIPQEFDTKQEVSEPVTAGVDENRDQLVTEITESLNEKHKTELASLESHYDAKIKELEEKYSGEINQLISRMDGHLTVNTGTMELAGVVSPVLSVPRLPLDRLDQEETMERQGSSGDDQSTVPTRSTPRDLDSERSIDRSETMETLVPPAQISPTSEMLSDRDHDSLKSEELIMRFDSESEDNGMEERPGARLGQYPPVDNGDFTSDEENSPGRPAAQLEEELIIPHLAMAQSMSPGQTTSPGDESKERQVEEKEQDESEADRSASPADILLQTQSLAGFTLPVSTGEFSTGSNTADFQETLLMEVKEKDEKIKQLEAEIQTLNEKMKKQIEEENLILLRREREAQEGQNLEELLRQDVSRVNKERDNIQQTNEHLLQLLSDAVKTFMGVEEAIGKKLSKIVVDTGDQSGHSGAKPSASAEHSPAGPTGAEGGEFHDSGDVPQETSILSNDEGLDLSQRLCESIFLDSEGEELLTDASQRLQGSVTRLLDMIEDTTHQLTDARRTQHDLVSTLSSGQQESQSLESRCQEMEDRLREQVEAKEFLALELHKAEGLIEGYSTEREMLEQRIQDLEEQKEALVLDLETTRNKLGDLETIHHEATSLRAEIQRQHDLVQENAGEEAQVSMTTREGAPPSGQALILEVHRVNDEKRELSQQLRNLQEQFEVRVRDLENAGEETERHYVALLEDKKAEMKDLQLQLDASEKQNKANRHFMEQEAIEREKEREDFQRELGKLEQKMVENQKEKKVETRLQRQVDDLTEQLQSRLDRDSEFVEQTAQLQRDLQDKQMSAEDMRALVIEQEKELEERGRMEDILRQKLREMEKELSQQHQVNTELSEIIKLPPNVESDEDEMIETGTSDGGRKSTTRHRRLLPSQLSLQQEEELLHEKEALQRRVEQQMKQISALENQVDTMRHRGGLGEDSQAATLQRQLERQTEFVETRDRQLEEQKEQIEDLASQLVSKEHLIQQLTDHIESTDGPEVTGQPDRDKVIEKLQDENMEMKTKIKSLQNKISSMPMPVLNQSLIMEKNQEIDHLNNQMEQLNYEIERLRSGQEIARLQAEVDRQQAELEQSRSDIQFLRASQASTFSGDGSDIEAPGVTESFSEKTNLQQEIEDSFALKYREETDELRGELQKSKSEVEKREEDIASLRRDLETLRNTDQNKILEFTEVLQQKQAEISTLKENQTMATKPKTDPKSLDHTQLKDLLQEKESQVEQMTIQIESLNSEVESLNDFQTKLSEDFDLVQSMLEEKERDIDLLTKELTEKSAESPSALTGLELEITRLQRDVKERDNIIEEKAEEMYLLNEKLEQQEMTLTDLKSQLKEKDFGEETSAKIEDLVQEKEVIIRDREQQIVKLQEAQDLLLEKDVIIRDREDQILKLQEAQDLLQEKDVVIKDREEQIVKLQEVQELLQEKDVVIKDREEQIVKLHDVQDLLQEREITINERDQQIAKLQEQLDTVQEHLKIAENLQRKLEEAGMLGPDILMKEKNAEIQSLQEEVSMLKEKLGAVTSEREPRQREPESVRRQEELTEYIQELEAVKLNNDTQIAVQTEEIIELRNELEATKKRQEDELKQHQEEIEMIKKELNSQSSEAEVTELRMEIAGLEDKLHGGDRQDVAELRREITCLNEESVTKDEEIQKLREEVTNLRQEETVDTESELESLREEVTQLKQDLQVARAGEVRTLPVDDEETSLDPSTPESQEIEVSESRDPQDKQLELVPQSSGPEAEPQEVTEDRILPESRDKVCGPPTSSANEETIQVLKEKVTSLENKIASYEKLEEKMLSSSSGVSSDERSQALEGRIVQLEQELNLYRGLDVGQVAEDLKEKDEEITILREALNAMKTGEDSLNLLLQEKDDSLIQMEGKLESMKAEGEVAESDKLLQDKVAEVIRLQQELVSIRQEMESKAKADISLMEEQLAKSHDEGRRLHDEVEWLQQQVDSLREMKLKEGDSQFDLEEKEKIIEDLQQEVTELRGQASVWSSEAMPDAQVTESTEQKMHEVTAHLAAKEREYKTLQDEYLKATAQLSDAITTLQQKEEKLSQTTAQLSEREEQLHSLQGELQLLQQEGDENRIQELLSELQEVRCEKDLLQREKDAEFEDMKEKLTQAVEFSEAQLQLVEEKEDEYVKLKLEMHQATADHDKLVKEKNKAVEMLEEELHQSKLSVEEKVEELEAKAQELDLVYADLQNNKQNLQATVDELERKAQELETRAQEMAKLRGELDQSSGIGLDLDVDVIPEIAQKRIDSLQMELNASRAAMFELQQKEAMQSQDASQLQSHDVSQLESQDVSYLQSGPEEKREPPVLRLRSDSQESEEDFGSLDTATLRLKMMALTQELKQTSSELELFRSSASLTAKDYVRKVMELREELSQQHQRHIHDIQERARHETDTTLMQLRIRYDDEIEHLRELHKKELENKIAEVRRDLDKEHKTEINKLIARHKQEMELAQVKEPTLAADQSTLEHVERLQAEISLSEKLDNRLRQSLSETAQGQGRMDKGDAGSNAASVATDLSFNENVPARLQSLMERLHKESVQVLSLSELQFLNQNLNTEKVDKEADLAALRSSWDNEKQSLMSAIQSLKDLLAQTHKLRGLDKENEAELSDFSAEITDWRGELLHSVGFVFAKERETLLAELRTHVMSHPNADLTEIHKLEKKIRTAESHQRSALDQIFHADRQSLLAEVRDLRAHINISQIRSQEERERLSDQLNDVEDQGNKRERQLKRQVKLLEYKLQQEKILQDDIRTSLDTERERNTELSSSLSREKMSNLDHQTDVSNLNLQVTKLKESLEREQSRFVSVTGALEEEKGKCHTLGERLEAEKYKVRDLKNDLEDAKVRAEVRDKINSTIEKLESDLMTERDLRIKLENSHELDRVKINTLQHDLNTERKNLQMFEAEYETKVTELKTALELEKIRASDLVNALEKEQAACHNLRQNLYEQQNSAEKSDNKGIVEDLQVALETEKAMVMDLRGALEHEKHRMAGMVAAVESERTAIQDELGQERDTTRQIKHELDTIQLQNLEFTRMFERERDQVLRLKAEREQLRTEVKAIKDADNERERLRDTEKMSERRRLRQVERERDDHKIKLHEQTLETQRLTQKVLDLQDQLAQSREKELEAIRDLERERLSTIHSQLYDGLQHTESPRGTTNANVSQDRWNVYKAQLQSLSQSLQYLILQHRDSLDRSSQADRSGEMQHALSDLLSELKQLQMPLEFESQNESNLLARPNPSVINERVLRHNADLTSFVTRLTEEKMDLRNSLGQMEEQLWRFQQRGTTQQNGDSTDGASNLFEERNNWAKERLSLQLALNDAEQRIDQLTVNLRMERDRHPVMSGSGSETEREKIQRLYGKYLRAESFRKALVYQKKYLLLLLGGFQDCEETTLAMLAQMGAYPSLEEVNSHQHRRRPYNIFRSAARVIVAITRMKYLVKKWRRATRVGSPVVGGSVNTQQAYMPTDRSFSPPRLTSGRSFSPPRINGSPPYNSGIFATRPSRVTFSASSPPADSDSPSSYQPIASRPAAAAVGSTPPTKDSLTRHITSRDPNPGARRKILSSSHKTKPSPHSSRSPHGYQAGATSSRPDQPKEALHDDYIKRLESLQKTLSSMSSSGTPRRGSSSPYH